MNATTPVTVTLDKADLGALRSLYLQRLYRARQMGRVADEYHGRHVAFYDRVKHNAIMGLQRIKPALEAAGFTTWTDGQL